MNPWLADKGPYFLLLLVSVLGWFLTNAVTEAKRQTLVNYSATLVRGEIDKAVYLQLDIRNDSIEQPLKGVRIEVTCRDAQPCFRVEEGQDGAGMAQQKHLAPWLVDIGGIDASNTVISFVPILPAGASTRISALLADASEMPEVFFDARKAEITPNIESGFSVRGLFYRHYFEILVGVSAALLVCFAIWALVLARSAPAELPTK